jgi:protein AaeX
MILKEIDAGGIYTAPFVGDMLIALPLFLLARWALARTGLLSRVWHPALFEAGLFCIILFAMSDLR